MKFTFSNYIILITLLILSCSDQNETKTTLDEGTENKYYTLTEYEDITSMQKSIPKNAINYYELIPLSGSDKFVRIDVFQELYQAEVDNQEIYQSLFKITGESEENPGFLIYAEWKLEDSTKINAFIKSRRTLFKLRQKLLPNFSFDILTKHLNKTNQYLILGFYKDETGLEQARNHPEIKKWAIGNSASHFSAKDLFSPKRFIINK